MMMMMMIHTQTNNHWTDNSATESHKENWKLTHKHRLFKNLHSTSATEFRFEFWKISEVNWIHTHSRTYRDFIYPEPFRVYFGEKWKCLNIHNLIDIHKMRMTASKVNGSWAKCLLLKAFCSENRFKYEYEC